MPSTTDPALRYPTGADPADVPADLHDLSDDAKAAFNAERTARIASDTAEATARANADATEATTRAGADTGLSNAISAEANSRVSADTALQVLIQAILDGTAALAGLDVSNPSGATLSLRDPDAGANIKRSRLLNSDGKTYIQAINDAYTAVVRNFLTLNHGDGSIGIFGDNPWEFDDRLTPAVRMPGAMIGGRFSKRWIRGVAHGSENTFRRQNLFWLTRDQGDWQNTAPVEVIVRHVGQMAGGYTRSFISRTDGGEQSKVTVVEAVGPGSVQGGVPIVPLVSADEAASGDLRSDKVYLDLPPYTDVLVEVIYDHFESLTIPSTSGALGAIGAAANITFDTSSTNNTGAGGSEWTGRKSNLAREPFTGEYVGTTTGVTGVEGGHTVTRISTGRYRVTYAQAQPTIGRVFYQAEFTNSIPLIVARTTTYHEVEFRTSGMALQNDPGPVSFLVHSK